MKTVDKKTIVTIIEKALKNTGLVYDGVGSPNFRKIKNQKAYHIYIRSQRSSSKLLKEVWHSIKGENQTQSKLVQKLIKNGASKVIINGGVADLECSLNVYYK